MNVYLFSYRFPDESDLHLLLRTSDWIITTRLHSYSLGNFALVLFCSVLVFSFECVCMGVCLEEGETDTEQIRLSGSRLVDLVSHAACVILGDLLNYF